MNMYIGNQAGFSLHILITDDSPSSTETKYTLHVYKEKPKRNPKGKFVHTQSLPYNEKRIECSEIPSNAQIQLTPHFKSVLFKISKFTDGDIAVDICLEN